MFGLLGCDTTEESSIELFAPDGQFLEVEFSDGQSFRLEAVPFAINTTQFFYSSEQLLASGFVNRRSLDGAINGNLNFNPRLPENVFDQEGLFIADSLELPYNIPMSNFLLGIEEPDNSRTEYDFEGVDVVIESWEGDQVSGRFTQDPLLINLEPVIITEGSFQVYLQPIKY